MCEPLPVYKVTERDGRIAPVELVLVTEAEQVATAAERWRRQYPSPRGYAKYEQLCALPPGATAKDVAAVIGNNTLVGETCIECHTHAVEYWHIGEAEDYESRTVYLCTTCARALAAAVMGEA